MCYSLTDILTDVPLQATSSTTQAVPTWLGWEIGVLIKTRRWNSMVSAV